MRLTEWFLTPVERSNPHTVLDSRHDRRLGTNDGEAGGDRTAGGTAYTSGNEVTPLIHGRSYFPELLRCIRQQRAGDLLLFTDWRGDPDQLLDGPGTEVSDVLVDACHRGVIVKGLVWRSHLDRLAFSEQENRHLGDDINAAGGECVRDMRVRSGGSHHQKFVVLRHPGRPELDVAFVGGIDLCHSRLDDAGHSGDVQKQPMAAVYGPRPPWHDVQVAVRGPAVGDVEAVFRERWSDPTPVDRNPIDVLTDRLRGEDTAPSPLPEQLPDPAPRGSQHVQLLRTYPFKRPGFPFAPKGERSVAHGYQKVLARACSLIYVEDQYFWNPQVVEGFAQALRRSPQLRLIVVLPRFPDQDGAISMPPNLVGRQQALDLVRAAGGDRVGVYGIENPAGVPVYVHAKVAVIDDVWASVGSDNVNRRSWTHDSELGCAVLDDEHDPREPRTIDGVGAGARRFARTLRLTLAAEHLDADHPDAQPFDLDRLCDPVAAFDAFADSAARLQAWYDAGSVGVRPPGRLRPYTFDRLDAKTLAWATPLYRTIYDPDGRPLALRRRHAF